MMYDQRMLLKTATSYIHFVSLSLFQPVFLQVMMYYQRRDPNQVNLLADLFRKFFYGKKLNTELYSKDLSDKTEREKNKNS